jgi:hypothetical protein
MFILYPTKTVFCDLRGNPLSPEYALPARIGRQGIRRESIRFTPGFLKEIKTTGPTVATGV